MRRFQRQFQRLLLLAGPALLAACISTPQRPADPVAVNAAWAIHQQQISAAQGFEAIGRVAVKGGGLSGALRWDQDGEHFKLRIAGPFGAGALSMEGTPDAVAIKGKDIDLVTREPERVLAERSGWRLPLDSLRWWVLGLPAPSPALAPDISLDGDGHALQIRQGDWTLRYSDYRSETLPALPGRIEATQGEWSATVIIETLLLKP